jgi:hypothetical protein
VATLKEEQKPGASRMNPSEEVTTMPVLWTIRARRNLRQVLARALCRESHGERVSPGAPAGQIGVWEATMDRLNDILASTFPGRSVVIKDQMLGYRRDPDRFILLVEVFGRDDDEKVGPYVVKIGTVERLEREIRGWNSCRPPGLHNDLVFLSLNPGVRIEDPPWMSLVYGDAQQFLGVVVTVSFEAAALETVRTGFPRIASIGVVLFELFERIGYLLYSAAFVDDPTTPTSEPPVFVFDLPRLDEALGLWETDPPCQAARRDVNTLANSGIGQFLDPVDYLRYVQAYVPWRIEAADGVTVRPPTARLAETRFGAKPERPGLLQPTIADLIPRMLRGCAHGDLHGRNILVGIIRDQAMWPTVYDYEDMGPCNLVGWDFVKLETELKIRAYLDVFPGGRPARWIASIQNFEIALNEQTERAHRDPPWPEAGDPTKPEDRLRAILLMIRRMAAQHLGSNPGRPNDWLEEYYFLLACYGAATSRFENQQMRERIAALLSAGVATARLSWPRQAW